MTTSEQALIELEQALIELRQMAEAMACKAAAEVYLNMRDQMPTGSEREWYTAQALRWNHRGKTAMTNPQAIMENWSPE